MSVVASSSVTCDFLKLYGLPSGVFPENVVSVDVDEQAGDFCIRLSQEQRVDVNNLPVHYDAVITGRIERGIIRGLKGIRAKRFVWVPVTRMTVSGRWLNLLAGTVRQRLPIASFRQSARNTL